jgi:hypothetical protein
MYNERVEPLHVSFLVAKLHTVRQVLCNHIEPLTQPTAFAARSDQEPKQLLSQLARGGHKQTNTNTAHGHPRVQPGTLACITLVTSVRARVPSLSGCVSTTLYCSGVAMHGQRNLPRFTHGHGVRSPEWRAYALRWCCMLHAVLPQCITLQPVQPGAAWCIMAQHGATPAHLRKKKLPTARNFESGNLRPAIRCSFWQTTRSCAVTAPQRATQCAASLIATQRVTSNSMWDVLLEAQSKRRTAPPIGASTACADGRAGTCGVLRGSRAAFSGGARGPTGLT